MGVRWEDGRLAAKQLFDGLRANGVDPTIQWYINVVDTQFNSMLALSTIQRRTIVAMGSVAQMAVRARGYPFLALIHPAARGKIRKKATYATHVQQALNLSIPLPVPRKRKVMLVRPFAAMNITPLRFTTPRLAQPAIRPTTR